MKKNIQLFNEKSTVDYFSEYLEKCLPQVFYQDVLHLSEEEIKMLAKVLSNKSKIQKIPLSILNEYKTIDLPLSKWVTKSEFDGGGTYYIFIRYQIAHSAQNLDLFELYPKNFYGNIIDKSHFEICKNYIEFHIDSEYCSMNNLADKIPVIAQKEIR